MYELILELVDKRRRWEFAKREIRIGRDPNCDLVLPTEEYPMVSRSHLLIRLAAERYWVEDLNTPGGTFVNGVQIQVNPLVDGDKLRLGVDGPELQVQIVASYRLESSDVAERRQSSSEEAPTGLRRITPVRSSQEAPTGGRVAVGSGTAEAPLGRAETAEGPGSPVQAGSGSPKAPEDEPPGPGRDAAPRLEEGAPAGVSASTTPAPATIGEPPSRTPPADIRTGAPAATESGPLPRELAILKRRVNALRNMMVVAIVLIVILGAVLIYHLRG